MTAKGLFIREKRALIEGVNQWAIGFKNLACGSLFARR
jgi:hypothetical protein